MKLNKIFSSGLAMFIIFTSFSNFSSSEMNYGHDFNENHILMLENSKTKTSCSISEMTYKSAKNVIISGENSTPDLLSSAPLSGLLKAPVLLCDGSKDNLDVDKEIQRLGAKTIYVISGEKIVSRDIIDRYRNEGYTIVNLSGKDRFDTSDKIADFIIRNNPKFEKSILINGINYADAPSISAFAYRHVTPILLTNGKTLTKKTYDVININKNILMVGGDNSISSKLYDELQDRFMKVGRISGKNRYETSKNIVEGLFEYNDKLLVADGKEDIDIGIISAGYCSLRYRPLILIKKNYKYEYILKDANKVYISRKALDDEMK